MSHFVGVSIFRIELNATDLGCCRSGFLPQGGEGAGGAPSEAVCPPRRLLPPPEIWSENNRKITVTKEICITIDFAPPEKIPRRKPVDWS